MTDYIREDIETDNMADAYRPITQAEVDAALQRISAYVEAIGNEPLTDETSQRIWNKISGQTHA